MDDVTIITNGQARDLLALCDLTPSEASDFDYITGEDTYSPRLFRYKGAVYDANEFMRANGESAPSHRPFAAWHGVGGNHIDRTGHAWQRALALNGLFARKDVTLKALHALPE